MRNPVICYFIFKKQSHYSGIRGQRVNRICNQVCINYLVLLDQFSAENVVTSKLQMDSFKHYIATPATTRSGAGLCESGPNIQPTKVHKTVY